MELHTDTIRFEEIVRHITELALGNFTARLKIRDKKDEMETLALLLNMLSEELQFSQYDTNHYSIQDKLTSISFLLDEKFRIVFIGPEVISTIGYNREYLLDKPLTDLICAESKTILENELKKVEPYSWEKYLKLKLRNAQGKFLKIYCNFYKLSNNNSFNLTAICINFKKLKDSEENSNLVPAKMHLHLKEDINKIRFVHDYVIKHLYETLPSLNELAGLAGTNEHKLKYGFKQIYKTSVFRFQARERMKQAKLLVTNTPMPITQISHQLGYKDLSHFSRIFKNEFGFSPKKFRKLNP